MLAAVYAHYYPSPAVSSQSVVHYDGGLSLGHLVAPAHYAVPLAYAAPLAHYAAPIAYDDHYDDHDEHDEHVCTYIYLN